MSEMNATQDRCAKMRLLEFLDEADTGVDGGKLEVWAGTETRTDNQS